MKTKIGQTEGLLAALAGKLAATHEGATDSAHGVVTSSENGFMAASDKTKLDGVAEAANNYAHPVNHAASVITQDTSNRFVTDTEKSTWNGKAPATVATTSANGLMSSTDKMKLDGVAESANNYVHPANHAASVITQDASNRFVTDAEKSTWNGKEPSFTKNTAFNKNFGSVADTVTQGNDARLSDARTPVSHAHGNISNTGAIGSTANLIVETGASGVLAAKVAGTTAQYLRGDGSWATPPDTIYAAVTTSVNGLMIASDKTKLDGVTAGAVPNQNAFSNIAVSGQTTVAADTATDTVTLVAGSNITITTDAATDAITINAAGQAYPVFNTTTDGLVPKTTTSNTTDYLRRDGTWASPPGGVTYTHPTTDGNLHVPATGTTNNGKALISGVTAGSAAWTALTATMVGLGSVTNESKATMFASPTFTGTPLTPTATPGTNTTQAASTEFVQAALSSFVSVPPATVAPLVEGTAAVGTATKYAREDHVHPSNALSGSSTFNTTTGVTITHNLGHTNYKVSITPTSSPGGYLGEYYVIKSANSMVVHCTGSTTTTTFDYVIIK